MGLEVIVARRFPVALAPVLERLTSLGLPCTMAMVDGQLVMPRSAPPLEWREVRLRSPAGMVTLARREGGVAVLVFGNADAAMIEAQRRICEALAAVGGEGPGEGSGT